MTIAPGSLPPAKLPVFYLPPNQLLFPNHALSNIHFDSTQAASIASLYASHKPLIIACFPLKASSPPLPSRLLLSINPNSSLSLTIPPRSSKNTSIDPEDYSQWGCLARVLALDSAPGLAVADLIGIARCRLDRPLRPHLALVSRFDELSFGTAPTDQANASLLLARFKDAAHAFFHALALSAPRPPASRDAVARLIDALKPPQLTHLIDLMVYHIPLISWPDKLAFLSYYELQVKVEKMTDLLSRLAAQIGAFYVKQTASPGAAPSSVPGLSRQQRELLLRRRMQSIQQELDALNQQYSSAFGTLPPLAPGPASVPAGFTTGAAMRPVVLGQRGSSGFLLPSAGAGGDADELDVLARKIAAAGMLPEAAEICAKELRRLRTVPPSSAEHGVLRTYLDTMVEIPWSRASDTRALHEGRFLERARAQLDADHYGMHAVKRRLVEFLALLKLRADLDGQSIAAEPGPPAPAASELDQHELGRLLADHLSPSPLPVSSPAPRPDPSRMTKRAPILLLVGPPGVGKTSVAQSIAKALGKKFYRISLGGVKDEAEIRGHRRTYVGAMPGAVVQALRRVGVNDPVILLDEIDKVGYSSTTGDPAAALLEVLDPSQNASFVDHYIHTPIDLSSVLFIATANATGPISGPLLDRLEPIELDGYVLEEKVQIGRRNLVPKQMTNYCLTSEQFAMGGVSQEEQEEVLRYVVLRYTREAGVRGLEREIGSLCRAKVLEWVEFQEGQGVAGDGSGAQQARFEGRIKVADVIRILGPERYEQEVSERDVRPGVALGLAYQASGTGTVLYIEAASYPGTGRLELTGSLGSVMRESGGLALSWVRAHAPALGIEADFGATDVHVHVPGGAVPKDGPSAGLAVIVALVSMFCGTKAVAKNGKAVGVTGEISLRGKVLPVGGVREKVLAAHRAGIEQVILPLQNMKDVESDSHVCGVVGHGEGRIEVVYVASVDEALRVVLFRGEEGGGSKVSGAARGGGGGGVGVSGGAEIEKGGGNGRERVERIVRGTHSLL